MNDNTANNTTKLPIALNNEATPYTAVFNVADPSATAVAVAISPDANFLSSEL